MRYLSCVAEAIIFLLGPIVSSNISRIVAYDMISLATITLLCDIYHAVTEGIIFLLTFIVPCNIYHIVAEQSYCRVLSVVLSPKETST